MNFDFAELERRLANVIRIGTVIAADYSGAKVIVRCDDIRTDWLPWITHRAGNDRDWWAPDIGEQVLVLAPSGQMDAAVVLPALYSDASPEPAASADIHTIRYGNGDTVTHDRAAGSWHVQCAGPVTVVAGGAVTVQAPSVTLDTPQTTCTGHLTVQAGLSVTWRSPGAVLHLLRSNDRMDGGGIAVIVIKRKAAGHQGHVDVNLCIGAMQRPSRGFLQQAKFHQHFCVFQYALGVASQAASQFTHANRACPQQMIDHLPAIRCQVPEKCLRRSKAQIFPLILPGRYAAFCTLKKPLRLDFQIWNDLYGECSHVAPRLVISRLKSADNWRRLVNV